MKILVCSHFYYPETGAASLRIQYLVKSLKSQENEIEIYTPMPNYPGNKFYKGYDKIYLKDKDRGVFYLPIFLPKKHSLINRALSYLSYNFVLFLFSSFRGFKPEVIITSSPPISTAFIAAVLSRIKGAKFVLDLRDIWPDIGVELGLLNNKMIVKLLKRVEKFILKTASAIIVTAEGDEENLINKETPAEKINVIYNGADIDVFKPLEKKEKESIREQYNLPKDKVLLIYFGSFNYGMNDIDILAKSLNGLSNLREKYHVFLVGNGDNRNYLLNEINNKVNYTVIDSLESGNLAKLVAASDASLIPRKRIKHDTGGNTPVKCFESWAAGIPVLLSANSESEIARIFNKCRAGYLVEPGSVDEYKMVLSNIINNPDCLKGLGKMGREFVKENYDRREHAEKVSKIIENIMI
ncbi:MAG TPA: glycosyltransferase family 4 protein [Ignavibacteriaceae bacterium]|nr:glycosyltransferase family 4 protein [Ignavibacteriaceae bacterium]